MLCYQCRDCLYLLLVQEGFVVMNTTMTRAVATPKTFPHQLEAAHRETDSCDVDWLLSCWSYRYATVDYRVLISARNLHMRRGLPGEFYFSTDRKAQSCVEHAHAVGGHN